MKYLIVLIACCTVCISCNKTVANWRSSTDYVDLTMVSQINVSFQPLGSYQLTGIRAQWFKDTLWINAQGNGTAVKIWLASSTLSDSTYWLDGRQGNVQLFDNLGNVAGFSTGNCTLSLYPQPDRSFNGHLSGTLNSFVSSPTTIPVDASLFNITIQGYR